MAYPKQTWLIAVMEYIDYFMLSVLKGLERVIRINMWQVVSCLLYWLEKCHMCDIT